LTTVYVAMDTEFDNVLGTLIRHRNVLYTFGYSWENDAWNKDLIESILKKLCHKPYNQSVVSNSLKNFVKDVRIGVYADGYQFSKGRSFFPRKGHMRLVECNPKIQPIIKKQYLNNLIHKQGLNKSTIYGFGLRKSLNPLMNCYGHLFGDFCRHIVHYVLTITGMGKLSSEIVRSLVMSEFTNFLSLEVKNHYKNILK